jgi:hypothetical protein
MWDKDPSASLQHFQDNKDPDAEEIQEVDLATLKMPRSSTLHIFFG